MKHFILCGYFSGMVISGYYLAETVEAALAALKAEIMKHYPEPVGLLLWPIVELSEAPIQFFQEPK